EKKGKQKVSTEPYKGVRDFYPEDQAIERYLLTKMKEGAEAFGYQEYNASPLEPSDLYTGKTSEEIVNEQTYTFLDRGGRSVTLRPEMTPTVARLVAAKRKALSFPVRLFSLPNVFRYERPQRGRLREHYQLNVDLFGVANLDAEVEVISLAHLLLISFGLKQEQFEIRINDRNSLNQALEKLNISAETKIQAIRLLDKKSKISDFDEQMTELVGQPLDIEETESTLVLELIDRLNALGISNVVYDRTLARGFDYYTGVVFEIFDTHPENNRSLFGGGRYDNLLEMFGEEAVPTVGFGMGDVVIRDVLSTYDLLPKDIRYSDVYVVVLGEENKLYAGNVAQGVRETGLRVTVDVRYDSLGNQLKRASTFGNRWALIVGDDERQSDILSLKNLETEEQVRVTFEELLTRVKV
ncbi:MAG: histidine--tRNA ligase, partial [Candidatus Paceibacterota bacterium]